LAKKVVWLPPAPEGRVLEVGLLYVPSEAQVQTELSTDGHAHVLYAGRLTDSRQVLLVSGAYPDRTFENQTKTLQEWAGQFRLAGISPSMLDASRLILGFELEGLRGYTEMAASSVGKPGLGKED
jgi:hypothetical protein